MKIIDKECSNRDCHVIFNRERDKGARYIYCSEKCSQEAKKILRQEAKKKLMAERPIPLCKGCGIAFTRKSTQKIYCCRTCANRHRNAIKPKQAIKPKLKKKLKPKLKKKLIKKEKRPVEMSKPINPYFLVRGNTSNIISTGLTSISGAA